jgi:hypothetical protein
VYLHIGSSLHQAAGRVERPCLLSLSDHCSSRRTVYSTGFFSLASGRPTSSGFLPA